MTAETIRRLLDAGDAFELDAASAAEITAFASTHATELEGARLFLTLVAHPAVEATAAAVSVANNADVLALAEIASWLGRGGRIPEARRSRIGKAFLRRAGDRGDGYGARAQALKASMIVAQSDRSLLRRLEADMLELDTSDDGHFLRHAARVVGAILACDPSDDLRNVLTTLAEVPEAEEEAAVELGLDALRTGLEAATSDAALASFRGASRWFARGDDAAPEGRIDARLYARCVGVLVDFQAGCAGEGLASRLDMIRQDALRYAGFLTSNDRSPETASWLSIKDTERVHWSSLALRLSTLAGRLSRSTWLQAAAVMEEELLSIYSASRSLFRRASDGALEDILRPRIVGAMGTELRSLHVLEQWIDENAVSGMVAEAAALRDLVKRARDDVITRRPSEAAVGSSPTAAIVERLPEGTRATVSARIEADALTLLDRSVSRIVDDVILNATVSLKRNVDYRDRPEVSSFIDVLLLYVTRFVVSRYNLSVASFPGVAYLFARGKDALPLEQDLQRDFIGFLLGSPLSSICTPEARDLGGGRVDVLFRYSWMATTSELKRSFPDLSSEELVDRYGPQAISYQGTTISVAMLIVLDLFDRGGAQPNIRDQITVYHRTLTGSSVENAVILFRIQGQRRTPSDVQRAALKVADTLT